MTPSRPKLAVYWAAACGGCEVSLLNLHDRLLQLADHFDLVYCPCLIDTKTDSIRNLPDQTIDVTLFNGAIRSSENEEMAHLLRRLSRVLVAFGSCAHEGCVPGLSNLHSRAEHFRDIFLANPTLDNPGGLIPATASAPPWGELELPVFHDAVKTLSQAVPVDLVIPGCPPESHRIAELLELLAGSAAELPAGAVTGSGESTVCNECPRQRDGRKLAGFKRLHEVIPDPAWCLLEQGIVCRGVVTREGCGALCPQVNMPCSGCYGAPDGMEDQGAGLVSALSGLLADPATADTPATEQTDQYRLAMSAVPDLAGTAYMYSLAASLLKGRRP